MKLKILIIGLLAIAGLKSFAQDIEYEYDLAGNRTARRVIVLASIIPTVEENTEGTGNEGKEEIIKYEENLGEKTMKIYPNPTRGMITVEIENYNLSDNGSIQVFDLGGRLVQNISQLGKNMEINITNEPAGSYIMVIVIGGERSEWKIIKQ